MDDHILKEKSLCSQSGCLGLNLIVYLLANLVGFYAIAHWQNWKSDLDCFMINIGHGKKTEP